MRKRFAPLTILVGLVTIVALACSSTPPPTPAPQLQSPPPPPAAQAPVAPAPGQPAPQPGGGGPSGGSVFAINMEDPGGSGEYLFDPADMTFSVGDTIEFTLTSESEFHTFTVDDLGIDVEVDSGETVTFTHTFDQSGEFGLICIPHELLGMVGTITVQ